MLQGYQVDGRHQVDKGLDELKTGRRSSVSPVANGGILQGIAILTLLFA